MEAFRLRRENAKFADKAEIYIEDKTHTSMTFIVVPEAVALRIYEDRPVDYHELLSCAEETDREFAVMLIRNEKKEFANFLGTYGHRCCKTKAQRIAERQ